MGSIRIGDLPGAIVPPDGFVLPRKVRRDRARMARREFMHLTAAAAVGTGIAFVSLFPSAKPARATNLTPSTTSSGCYGPSGGEGSYAGSTGCCSCGSLVNSAYCDTDGWHRHHSISGGLAQYTLRLTSCDDQPGTGANSWTWSRSGVLWRCSDGQARSCSPGFPCSNWVDTVCPSTSWA